MRASVITYLSLCLLRCTDASYICCQFASIICHFKVCIPVMICISMKPYKGSVRASVITYLSLCLLRCTDASYICCQFASIICHFKVCIPVMICISMKPYKGSVRASVITYLSLCLLRCTDAPYICCQFASIICHFKVCIPVMICIYMKLYKGSERASVNTYLCLCLLRCTDASYICCQYVSIICYFKVCI